jgi:hypothetical protein
MRKLSQRSVAIDKKKESHCEILASTLRYAWTISFGERSYPNPDDSIPHHIHPFIHPDALLDVEASRYQQ